MKLRKLSYRLLLCVVLAITAVFLDQAWEHLQGSLDYLALERIKARWEEGSGVPRDRQLNEVFTLGYDASVYESDNSDYRYMLASLHAQRERGLRLWPGREAAENRKTIESLKAALIRRPSWFEPWILLALVKYQTGEMDHELAVALEKSIETGACETVVHYGLAYVALRVWNKLGPQLQRSIVHTLNIGLRNPRINEFVVEQIVMTGRIDLFRDKLESDKDLTRLMNKYLEEERRKSL